MNSKLFVSAALFFCAVAFTGTKAHAQYSQEYTNCYGRAHGTVQQSMCAQTELSKQDARLNKAYQQLMNQYGSQPDKKVTLRTEERSWLKKRDYDCNLGREVTDESCVMKKTAERADTLEQQLKF